MKKTAYLLALILASAGLVWLGLRETPSLTAPGGRSPAEEASGDSLAWVERRPGTGRIRFRVEAETVVRRGDTTTTGPIRGWFYPETAPGEPTTVLAAGAEVATTGREPVAREILFAGTTEVDLASSGIRVRGSGIRWRRETDRIESPEAVRMEGEGGGWIEGTGFELEPSKKRVRVLHVRGEWPMR